MKTINITPDLFEGTVSVERVAAGWKPWRLPHTQQSLFPSPDEALLTRAQNASGVRLRFTTDATHIHVTMDLQQAVDARAERDAFYVDATIEGDLVQSLPMKPGETDARFDALPAGTKTVEIWLPQDTPVVFRQLAIDGGASCTVNEDPRPRWITYGSSLTHCIRAHSPARTWPAIIARRYGLNLVNLGFGGQCCIEPMLGFVIRDMPADFITLKLGINCIGAGHLSARTYPANALGLVRVIRDRQPSTPIVLISPIGHPPTETTPSPNGYTTSGMRRDLDDVTRRLVAAGDEHLSYVDGLEVFSLAEIDEWSKDECHPNADGIEVMADNFDRAVMQQFYKDNAAMGRGLMGFHCEFKLDENPVADAQARGYYERFMAGAPVAGWISASDIQEP